MITTFLLNMIAGVFQGLFSIIPAWTINDGTVTQWANFAHIGGSANGYVPENELLLCMLLIIGVRFFFLAWDGLLFLYRLIPFNG